MNMFQVRKLDFKLTIRFLEKNKQIDGLKNTIEHLRGIIANLRKENKSKGDKIAEHEELSSTMNM